MRRRRKKAGYSVLSSIISLLIATGLLSTSDVKNIGKKIATNVVSNITADKNDYQRSAEEIADFVKAYSPASKDKKEINKIIKDAKKKLNLYYLEVNYDQITNELVIFKEIEGKTIFIKRFSLN